jgi:hypothetical protein
MLTAVALAGAFVAFVPSVNGEDVDASLSFETKPEDGVPGGWGGGPPLTLGTDESIRYRGERAGKITRTRESRNEFSSLTKVLPADVGGSRLTLKAWVRSRNVDDYFGLWLRQDGRKGPLDFANDYRLRHKGDQEWREISVSANLSDKADQIVFGVILKGTGTVWIDDVRLLVDDKPYSEAPKRQRVVLPWETDSEFDLGSGIGDLELTPEQVENIATLIELWGFVKYHHPSIAAGKINIDYELFRALPDVLAAEDDVARNRFLLDWVRGLGPVDPCTDCAGLPENIHLDAPIGWIHDTDRLGNELVLALQSIYRNRPSDGEHVFVSRAPSVGNAKFENESPYSKLDTIDAGFRLLALARIFGIVEYWFPYRDLLDKSWPEVLRAAIPRLSAPLDADGYARELIRTIADINDTHANLWGSLHVRPPQGDCSLEASFRFIEGEAVVWNLPSPNTSQLEIGDVLVELDGYAVPDLVEAWTAYYAASNQPTRLRDIGRALPVGPCGRTGLQVRRMIDGRAEHLKLGIERKDKEEIDKLDLFRHDRPGDTYQVLSNKVAYVKLSTIELKDVENLVKRARGKAGLVIDIRNYPSAFVVFELGQRLVTKSTRFASFTHGDLGNPGVFVWGKVLSLDPATPAFSGKVAILVDEITQSQAEYTAMALRVSEKAMVVGSTTAGADGNVSNIRLPGRLRTMISGIGVFYPDGSPTQRIGILPDIEAKPTIAGVRAGRDEVLEAALTYILGDEVSEEEISTIALRP